MSGSRFVNNFVVYGGGAIENGDAILYLSDSYFVDNSATNGGAIDNDGGRGLLLCLILLSLKMILILWEVFIKIVF